jgi:hypothetical protein
VRLNEYFKLLNIHLSKFIFCLIIVLVFFPCRNIYTQRQKVIYDSVFVSNHSPIKAQLYSAVLPGLGQIYNRKYWKVPIIYGIGGAVVFTYFYNNYYYKELNDAYIQVSYMDPPPTSYEFRGREIRGSNIAQIFYNAKEEARKYKDYALVSIAAVYLLNIIDAMIDTYFLDYDISDDISFKLTPALINNDVFASSMGIRLCIKF